jgi:hypothetical protein
MQGQQQPGMQGQQQPNGIYGPPMQPGMQGQQQPGMQGQQQPNGIYGPPMQPGVQQAGMNPKQKPASKKQAETSKQAENHERNGKRSLRA